MAIPPLEFVQRSEETPITKEEIFRRFTSPSAVGQNLFELLGAWDRSARRVLSEHGIRESAWPSTWPTYIKAAPAEVKDAWRILVASGKLRGAMHPKEPHDVFALADAGIKLGLAIMEAHTRPYTQTAAIGERNLFGSREGAKATHGTPEERETKYAEMRRRYDQLHADHQKWNHQALTDKIGEEFNVSGRRIRDHVPNTVSPRKPRRKV